ncbi:hypothetical protein [Scytonema hofmannii]|nr:hypothetical protein [Scytonema hofmannii]
MATKSTKTKVVTIDDSAMEQFKVESFDVRKYNAIFYSIRDLYGKESQRQLGSDNFDWKTFKTQFEICFGTAEERRYTTEQLLTFAQTKFNMGLSELLAYNRKSWELRTRREQQYAEMEEINVKPFPELTDSPVDDSQVLDEMPHS